MIVIEIMKKRMFYELYDVVYKVIALVVSIHGNVLDLFHINIVREAFVTVYQNSW